MSQGSLLSSALIFLVITTSMSQPDEGFWTDTAERWIIARDSAFLAYRDGSYGTVISIFETIATEDSSLLDNNLIAAASDSYQHIQPQTALNQQKSRELMSYGILKYGQQVMKEGFGTSVFIIVEKMPEPAMGEERFRQYLLNCYNYPEAAQNKGIQGVVYLQFIVNKDSTIDALHIVKGIDAACDREALRLILAEPEWIPGKHKGRAVYTRVIMPVSFDLKQYRRRLKRSARKVQVQDDNGNRK